MVELRENEAAILKALPPTGHSSFDDLVKASGQTNAAATRALTILQEKQLVKVTESETVILRLSEEGLDYAKRGLPERRLVRAVLDMGGEAVLDQATKNAHIPPSLTAIALGWVKSTHWCNVSENEKIVLRASKMPDKTDIEKTLELMSSKPPHFIEELPVELRKNVETLKRRRLVLSRKHTRRFVELTQEGMEALEHGIKVPDELSEVTPELITTRRWQTVTFRKYNLTAAVTPAWPGKRQPYRQFLDLLKTKLVALGFEEMAGPTVELMFFNCDALFMPQDHPARDIHDLYFIKTNRLGQLGENERFIEPVAKTHENGWKTGSTGWGYKYSHSEAHKMILRSQGTALSARTLASKNLRIPGKYFSIVRCFRPDPVDRTHLTEFNQVEGIVVGPNLSLRDLLGVLQRFAIEIAGADKVRFKPDYFPFTEPSVELQAYKKGYGWLEFGGSGIFRPELTIPLGITVPVLAWGIGVDRLFMMRAGLDDIRMLFAQNLEWIRRQKAI